MAARRPRRVMGARFVFTAWAPPDASRLQAHPRLRFVAFAPERAPTTYRLHWQGYVEFSGSGSMARGQVQALLASGTGKPPTAHVEVARGTRAQAVAYLRKGAQGDALQALVEYERPTPQRPVVRGRDRVSELMQRIIDQEPYDALLLQYGAVFARHGAFVDLLFLHYQPPPLPSSRYF